jgi:hypothetical protein
LLSCAVELEASVAAALGFEGYAQYLHPRLTHLALLRGDLGRAEELFDESGEPGFGPWTRASTQLRPVSKLVALGRTEEADTEATRLTEPGTYLEPFALRTLGFVRGDPALVQHSIERLESLGLHWHAAKTRELAPRG